MIDPSVGELIDGRYQIEAPIGRGGMGSVWRARHVFTNVRVALKLLIDEYDAIAFERFLAEARAASTIGHPAIVVVSDANRMANNQLYLAMELLAGKPLRVAIASGAVGSGDQIRRIGLEILDALGAAHTRGIIHRDLKPENIFLVAPSSTVKLLDFGIAKVLGGVSGRSTHSMGVLGTVEYMAPEQLADASNVDGRADLWALAVILYEMIAGMRPFGGATPGERLQALMNEEPTPIGEIVPVPPQVAAFFEIALAKDRNRRFGTAAAMSQALRSLAFASGAVPSAGAGLTLGTGAGWAGDKPDPPSGNLPGPTMGTGAGWQRLPGPTSTGDPHGRDRDDPAPPEPSPPSSRRRGRTLALALAGVLVVGGALTVGLVVGSSRGSGSPDAGVAADARVVAPDAAVVVVVADARVARADATVAIVDAATRAHPRDAASVPPDAATAPVVGVDVGLVETCKAGCAALARCSLALPSCQQDCQNRFMSPDCIQNAGSSCEALASCHWARICSRPVKTGGMSCVQATTCHASVAMQDTSVLCNQCIDHLSPTAARDYARFLICNASIVSTPDQWKTRCEPLSNACTGKKP